MYDPNAGLRKVLAESPLAAAVVDGRDQEAAARDAALLHEVADTIPDSAMHDEAHAAGAYAALRAGLPYDASYLDRWLDELLRKYRR